MPPGDLENCYAVRWYFEQNLQCNVIIYLEHFIADILLKLACSQLYKSTALCIVAVYFAIVYGPCYCRSQK